MDVVAKKDGSKNIQFLKEHTLCVVKGALELIDDEMLEFISQKCGYDKDRIKDLIFFAAFFHDIGKATEEFCDTMEEEEKSYHSLYSGNIVSGIVDFLLDDENYVNLLFLVILTHHSMYNFCITFSSIDRRKEFIHHFLPYAQEFFYQHKHYYEKFFGKKCSYNFAYNEKDIKKLNEDINEDCGLHDNIREIKNYKTFRLLYCYISGMLNIADWEASAKFDGYFPNTAFWELPTTKDILLRLERALKIDKFFPKNFQHELSITKGSVLVEIPTGEGKTEGAFLWAVNNIRNTRSKIIVTAQQLTN